jgi:hypothetical protein
MLKSFGNFIKEDLDYPVLKISMLLDKMTPDLKIKIFDLTEEKGDIQIALYELSKNKTLFDEIWKGFHDQLYFMHQESVEDEWDSDDNEYDGNDGDDNDEIVNLMKSKYTNSKSYEDMNKDELNKALNKALDNNDFESIKIIKDYL